MPSRPSERPKPRKAAEAIAPQSWLGIEITALSTRTNPRTGDRR
ncbi:hypothetical protein [Laspinema sp. D2d]|nr:hypothetical protein [Laspinema sp. D2d]